jgi:hypothetical protein
MSVRRKKVRREFKFKKWRRKRGKKKFLTIPKRSKDITRETFKMRYQLYGKYSGLLARALFNKQGEDSKENRQVLKRIVNKEAKSYISQLTPQDMMVHLDAEPNFFPYTLDRDFMRMNADDPQVLMVKEAFATALKTSLTYEFKSKYRKLLSLYEIPYLKQITEFASTKRFSRSVLSSKVQLDCTNFMVSRNRHLMPKYYCTQFSKKNR